MIDHEDAAVALFEAHRDTLDSTNRTEWSDLRPDIRERYRRVVGMLLLNLEIPFKRDSDAHYS